MSEATIPVSEAARDFLPILDLVERRQEPATLLRDGKAVARLVPIAAAAQTCEDLATRWEKLEKLPPDEAEAFASDVEHARASLPPVTSAWD
jgi:antitoxin (DNA-binding transcriptional repressor) of toxin-antitoxin stability system